MVTNLQEYSRLLTRNRSSDYQEWKENSILEYPEWRADFFILENPQNWKSLFQAMSNLGYTQSDIADHGVSSRIYNRSEVFSHMESG